MDAISLAVDRASDRRLADLQDAQDMADRQRECAWDDARREVQQSGVIRSEERRVGKECRL